MRTISRLVTSLLVTLLSLPVLAAPSHQHVRSVASDGWMITWSGHRASASKAGRTVALYAFSKPERGCGGEFSGRVLSIVGSLVSTEVVESGYCEGAAHPYGGTLWRTVDLARGGAEVRLDELYPAATLTPVLLNDSAIRRMRIFATMDDAPPDELPRDDGRTLPPLSFDELRALEIVTCKGSLSDLGNSAFAFLGVRGDKALVRVGLPSHWGMCRSMFTQLGLELPLPAGWETALRSAGKEGRLMDRLGHK